MYSKLMEQKTIIQCQKEVYGKTKRQLQEICWTMTAWVEPDSEESATLWSLLAGNHPPVHGIPNHGLMQQLEKPEAKPKVLNAETAYGARQQTGVAMLLGPRMGE